MKFNSSMVKAFAIVSLLALPAVAFAQLNLNAPANAGFFTNFFGCTATAGTGGTTICILQKVLLFLLAIAFIVAVIFLVVGGFRYIVSQGNEDSLEKAKGTITNAIIGIVVIVLAYIILQLIFGVVQTGTA
ncbi:MAG: hypothetical protein A2722_02275 [Candidatus Doudnabacteria bacterium RIFCSPHIGHO2_01_FULL_50_11]|uniref:Uncharacterized protein n=1 Tax=Candidatus Doudnabacteria bacterium RIFCSPHIGHO2_01_FULL_50_11 TaxID=1817828 RepID=A0A1F5PJ04_9BACT|nr:MAG: hypothetical protein A2722_02275 [Candidatus Doudnabacteria bacterium RIFCSPHIGHO2_01_FULL_50_11]HLC44596.1 hypothetical protein [Patescibacteria group bacterium]